MFGAERGMGRLSLFFYFTKKEINVLHELANQNEASWELVAVDVANTWGWPGVGDAKKKKKKGWWDSGMIEQQQNKKKQW